MERYIYTVVISTSNERPDGTALPDAYSSYEDAIAAVNARFDRPWQNHEMFYDYSIRCMRNMEDWKKYWSSLPEDKRANYVEEGSKFFEDDDENNTNATQIPIDDYWFVNIYKLKLK